MVKNTNGSKGVSRRDTASFQREREELKPKAFILSTVEMTIEDDLEMIRQAESISQVYSP